jgi:hypothetical protein
MRFKLNTRDDVLRALAATAAASVGDSGRKPWNLVLNADEPPRLERDGERIEGHAAVRDNLVGRCLVRLNAKRQIVEREQQEIREMEEIIAAAKTK